MTGISGKQLIIFVWLIFVLLFVLYLANADRVCRAFDGQAYFVKLPENATLRANWSLNITRWFSPRRVKNKFEEGVAYWGQFDEVSHPTGDVKLRVFFRSKDAIYEVAKNRRSFLTPATNIMTSSIFVSTLGLENGVYTLGLMLCDENGDKLAWVNSSFEKFEDGPGRYLALPMTLQPTRSREDLKFTMKVILFSKGEGKRKYWLIQGGMSIENGVMDDYNAYVMVKDSAGVSKIFYAPLISQPEVVSGDEKIRLASGGFDLKLRCRELSHGSHLVKVIIESRLTGEVVESMQEQSLIF